MKPIKCGVCTKVKGKRVCQINGGALICPRCCAEIRNPECEGCSYYSQAEQYQADKALRMAKAGKLGDEHFMMRVDPEVDAAVDQAMIMVEGGNLAMGEAMITDLLKKHPDIHTVQYGMGVICALHGRLDEAIARFDKAIEIFPYFGEAWYNKATACQKVMDIKNTLRSLEKVVQFGDPKDDYVQNAKVQLRDFENNIRKESGISLAAYLAAYDRFDEAFEKMDAGQWEQALAGFKEVLALNPNTHQAYGNMGICHGILGRRDEALAAIDKALEIEPDYEVALLNRTGIENLKEGERLPLERFLSVNDPKDYKTKGPSLLGQVVDKLKV